MSYYNQLDKYNFIILEKKVKYCKMKYIYIFLIPFNYKKL